MKKTCRLRHGLAGAVLAAAFLGAGMAPAEARTKLAALPEREAVTIRLDNPEATLVEEERVLALREGDNLVDFSWRGVQIDPDSIRLAMLGKPGAATLLSVAYPPQEAALVWKIHARAAGEEKVRISYLLSRIDRLITYRAVASREEKTLDLEGFLVVRNFSGEDFPAADICLQEGRPYAGRVGHEETRQVSFLAARNIPVRKTFTWDAATLPWEPKRLNVNVGIPVHYEIENGKAAGLGKAVLWGGKVRVFQDDGRGGTLFLGEDRVSSTPVAETMRVHIGESRDVAVTQVKTRERAFNHRPSKFKAALYDQEEVLEARVENFKDQAVTVDLVQHIPGEWKMLEASLPYERKNAETVVFAVPVAGKGSRTLSFRYERYNIRP